MDLCGAENSNIRLILTDVCWWVSLAQAVDGVQIETDDPGMDCSTWLQPMTETNSEQLQNPSLDIHM